VKAADWRHLDNLPFDEFQAGILSEDARLAQALELLGGERVFRDFD
jgi:hypothetical protein